MITMTTSNALETSIHADYAPSDYTFVLRIDDRPGVMELIAATFAHRGLSLTSTLGNDGTLDPEGVGTVLVRFRATPARKEALKATLLRLSRVRSVTEPGIDSDPKTEVRQSALLRLAPGAGSPESGPDCYVEIVSINATSGESTFALLGTLEAVGARIEAARKAGVLRKVTQTVLAI